MYENDLLKVGTFAKLARTTWYMLYHYEKIGLLSPKIRGKNKYRYYSSGQLAEVNLIHTLQDLGMSLTQIKELKDKRTAKFLAESFATQIIKIDAKMKELQSARNLLFTLQNTISAVLNVNEQEVKIQFLPAEAIILGNFNDYSAGKDDYSTLPAFYQTMAKKYPGINLNYPVWAIFSGDRIKRGDWIWPDRYYFYNPEGYDQRPAAHYAIGYKRGGYGQNDDLYKRLLNYIDEQGFEICGDAYEEYPINEICVTDGADYLVRVMVTVQKKPV